MYESKNEPLLPIKHFTWRLFLHVLCALLVMVFTLIIGVIAHLLFEPISWHDAVLNTAFIVSGIGPFFYPETVAGKVMLAGYGMLVSLVFMASLGIILAPVAHRIIHKFHLDEE